jgi:hypothetical protein
MASDDPALQRWIDLLAESEKEREREEELRKQLDPRDWHRRQLAQAHLYLERLQAQTDMERQRLASRVLPPGQPISANRPDRTPDGPALETRATKPIKRRTGAQAHAFSIEVWGRLDRLLDERKAALSAGRVTDNKLSQQSIADRLTFATGVKFSHSRVQRAEEARNLALDANGWDLPTLLRSHSEFSAGNGLYRLLGVEKLRDLLGFRAP